MQHGIQITCFAASYGLALSLELIGLRIRTSVRRLALMSIVGAGLAAHTWYLARRAAELSAWPLSSASDWCLVAAWVLATLYLVLTITDRQTAMGLFVVPSILALIGVAELAGQQRFSTDRASRLWGNVHGTCLLLGTVAVTIGFVAGVMYLVHSWRLKRKIPPSRGFRLPSLERLERINSRALAVSAIFITIGFASGIVLRQIKVGRQGGELPWSDPVVISLGSMMLWLIVTEVLRVGYPSARRGRRVAYLTVAAFVFLCMTLFALFGLTTNHVARQDAFRNGQHVLAADPLDRDHTDGLFFQRPPGPGRRS